MTLCLVEGAKTFEPERTSELGITQPAFTNCKYVNFNNHWELWVSSNLSLYVECPSISSMLHPDWNRVRTG